MIAGFFFILYILFLGWITGVSALLLASRLQRIQSDTIHPVLTILIGLTAIAFIIQPLHLFLPVNCWSHLFIWSFNFLVWIWVKHDVKGFATGQWNAYYDAKWRIWLPLLMVAALINLLGRAGVGDIGDYHLQAIRWDEQYPVVHGLGNLRRQLGNNSNWFLLHAFSGFSFLGFRSVYILNTVILICGIWYFLPGNKKEFAILNGVCFVYLVLMSFRKYVGAVTNDYAITVYTLVLLTEWLKAGRVKQLGHIYLIWIVLFLPTFKLSAMTMLLLVPIFWLQTEKENKRQMILFILVAGALIYVPWLYTNVNLSGYLVYPVEATAIGAPDWQMRPEMLQFERIINKANERMPGMPLMEVMKLSFTQWSPQWLKHLDLFSKLLLILTFLLPVWVISKRYFNNTFRQQIKVEWSTRGISMLMFIILFALIVWFFNAPATRFVFGYLVFIIGLMSQWLFEEKKVPFLNRYFLHLCFLILAINAGFFVYTYLPNKDLKQMILTPPLYSNQTLQRINLTKGFVMKPDSLSQCWDSDLPCTSMIDSTLHWRTNDLKDGFSVQ